jgi:hypothetical protein
MITATKPGWQTDERPDAKWARVVVPTQFQDHCNVWHPVFVTIKWETPRLSITGVEGPKANGDCWGGAGQIQLEPQHPAPGWQTDDVERLQAVWDRWHLNDMRAGTPAQQACLAEHEFPGYPINHFDWAQAVLDRAGLQPDGGYRYGSAWLTEEVPDDVLDYLWSLPNTLRAHPWGRNG